MTNLTRLSPSTLGLFKECPRCFWYHINEKHRRPRGPFPSLPGGMDLRIKDYFDNYRGKLPPELEGRIKGFLMKDLRTLNKWRNWRTGLTYTDNNLGVQLFGALDDCLTDEEDNYIALDYKTRGSSPKEETSKYYQHQLDLYTLLLVKNGYSIRNFAYLVYYFPKRVEEGGTVIFEVQPKKITVNWKEGLKLLEEAAKLLKRPAPQHHTGCKFCAWQQLAEEFD